MNSPISSVEDWNYYSRSLRGRPTTKGTGNLFAKLKNRGKFYMKIKLSVWRRWTYQGASRLFLHWQKVMRSRRAIFVNAGCLIRFIDAIQEFALHMQRKPKCTNCAARWQCWVEMGGCSSDMRITKNPDKATPVNKLDIDMNAKRARSWKDLFWFLNALKLNLAIIRAKFSLSKQDQN